MRRLGSQMSKYDDRTMARLLATERVEMTSDPVPRRSIRLLPWFPILKRAFASSTIILSLAACDTRASRFPVAEDLCAEEGRTIPAFDKKVRALAQLHGQNRLPSYLHQAIASGAQGELTPRNVRSSIAEYLRREPLCCQILQPDHLGNQIWNGEHWLDDVGYRRELSWGYVGDLYVFNRAPTADRPFREIPGSIRLEDIELQRVNLPGGRFTVIAPGSTWMINNCGETRNFDRG
jgi:hypothetical protein